MPELKGQKVKMICYVDSNHVYNIVTRRSKSVHIIVLNSTPVDWFSKKQATVEVATYRAKFVALKTAVEKFKAW